MKRLFWYSALIIASITLAITTASTARANPPSQFCSEHSGSLGYCFDRAGNGTQAGTWIIGWSFGNYSNNYFQLVTVNVSWCGNSNWVHNGENGLVCPFANGSGLNARYDHQPIFEILAPNIGCAAETDADFSINLQPCGGSGWLFVEGSKDSAGYYWWVNVEASNYSYTHGGPAGQPYWITDTADASHTQGARIYVTTGDTYLWDQVS